MIKILNKLQKLTLLRDYILIHNSMGYEVRDIIGHGLSYYNFEVMYNNLCEFNEEHFENNKCYYFCYSPIYQNCFENKLKTNENE